MTDIGSPDGVGRDTDLAGPDFVGIVFDLTRLREKLGEFFLGDGDYFSGVVNYQRSGTRRSLVQC